MRLERWGSNRIPPESRMMRYGLRRIAGGRVASVDGLFPFEPSASIPPVSS
jgi:hypothetical protein